MDLTLLKVISRLTIRLVLDGTFPSFKALSRLNPEKPRFFRFNQFKISN